LRGHKKKKMRFQAIEKDNKILFPQNISMIDKLIKEKKTLRQQMARIK
jgi:hypothetical protein